jgi:signal transduction histidine kinase
MIQQGGIHEMEKVNLEPRTEEEALPLKLTLSNEDVFHNGRVSVNSEEGKGSVFSVCIPIFERRVCQ